MKLHLSIAFMAFACCCLWGQVTSQSKWITWRMNVNFVPGFSLFIEHFGWLAGTHSGKYNDWKHAVVALQNATTLQEIPGLLSGHNLWKKRRSESSDGFWGLWLRHEWLTPPLVVLLEPIPDGTFNDFALVDLVVPNSISISWKRNWVFLEIALFELSLMFRESGLVRSNLSS